MAKFSCSLFILAVFLGGTAGDLMCILKELTQVSPDLFLTNPVRACRNVDGTFRRSRQELKKCLDFEIDLSMMESLYNEFCDSTSDFRQKVDRQKQCLSVSMPKAMDCIHNSASLTPEDIIRKPIYDICHSTALDMAKCLGEKVGGPCGEEGLEVYGRMAAVSAPFFTGTCYSVARLGMDKSEFDEQVAEAEQKAVDSSMAESERDRQLAAAAILNSSPSWWIFMGLSLIAICLVI